MFVNIAQQLFVEPPIPVAQEVAYGRYIPPGNGWMLRLHRFWDVARGLADDLDEALISGPTERIAQNLRHPLPVAKQMEVCNRSPNVVDTLANALGAQNISTFAAIGLVKKRFGNERRVTT